jgi:hypothetical protein
MSRRARSRAVVFTLAALLVLPGVELEAAGHEKIVEETIASGIALRREHRDADALSAFRRAYSIDPSADILAQIALAEAALGQWVAGEADLLRALAANDPWIETRRAPLHVALAEIDEHLATLSVDGPDGAELWADGVFLARLPTGFLRVPAKRLSLELRARGFAAVHRELDVTPRALERVTFVLESSPPPPTPPTPPEASKPPAGAAPSPDVHAAAVPEHAPGSGYRAPRIAAWTLGGGAVAFLATGIGLNLYALNRAGHYNSDADCADTASQPRSVLCGSIRSEFDAAQAGEIVSYALAGAAGVGSAALFLLFRPHAARGPSATCTPSPFAISCAFAF